MFILIVFWAVVKFGSTQYGFLKEDEMYLNITKLSMDTVVRHLLASDEDCSSKLWKTLGATPNATPLEKLIKICLSNDLSLAPYEQAVTEIGWRSLEFNAKSKLSFGKFSDFDRGIQTMVALRSLCWGLINRNDVPAARRACGHFIAITSQFLMVKFYADKNFYARSVRPTKSSFKKYINNFTKPLLRMFHFDRISLKESAEKNSVKFVAEIIAQNLVDIARSFMKSPTTKNSKKVITPDIRPHQLPFWNIIGLTRPSVVFFFDIPCRSHTDLVDQVRNHVITSLEKCDPRFKIIFVRTLINKSGIGQTEGRIYAEFLSCSEVAENAEDLRDQIRQLLKKTADCSATKQTSNLQSSPILLNSLKQDSRLFIFTQDITGNGRGILLQPDIPGVLNLLEDLLLFVHVRKIRSDVFVLTENVKNIPPVSNLKSSTLDTLFRISKQHGGWFLPYQKDVILPKTSLNFILNDRLLIFDQIIAPAKEYSFSYTEFMDKKPQKAIATVYCSKLAVVRLNQDLATDMKPVQILELGTSTLNIYQEQKSAVCYGQVFLPNSSASLAFQLIHNFTKKSRKYLMSSFYLKQPPQHPSVLSLSNINFNENGQICSVQKVPYTMAFEKNEGQGAGALWSMLSMCHQFATSFEDNHPYFLRVFVKNPNTGRNLSWLLPYSIAPAIQGFQGKSKEINLSDTRSSINNNAFYNEFTGLQATFDQAPLQISYKVKSAMRLEYLVSDCRVNDSYFIPNSRTTSNIVNRWGHCTLPNIAQQVCAKAFFTSTKRSSNSPSYSFSCMWLVHSDTGTNFRDELPELTIKRTEREPQKICSQIRSWNNCSDKNWHLNLNFRGKVHGIFRYAWPVNASKAVVINVAEKSSNEADVRGDCCAVNVSLVAVSSDTGLSHTVTISVNPNLARASEVIGLGRIASPLIVVISVLLVLLLIVIIIAIVFIIKRRNKQTTVLHKIKEPRFTKLAVEPTEDKPATPAARKLRPEVSV